MADTAISALPEASALDGTELYAVVQDGTIKRTTLGTAAVSDDAWTEVTDLDNGWTGDVKYIKRAGWVTISIVTDGTSATASEILVLPSDYRPEEEIWATARVDGQTDIHSWRIQASGSVNNFPTGSGAPTVRASATYPVL